ncbi:COP9 signalosome complex subunit 7a [Magnaporthiopsis poae ATCC 64411]|uniref:COP9 signalosome complex subunit 7a n=1 Tax=Magnaporthiopsis poae (strain ATCC 64411 / 73-15) TaxID=644358 RepID=A0A0C4E3I7_MAGP6|nr:COP9 signalosome complex subunit 7a [Magnaporthiopsis poae ATCC 64411]
MEQVKALNALEPFLALSKSATSPRAAADLVMRATSAPNTFIFAELLDRPQIQALASSPEHAPALQLLRIFSYGTRRAYSSTPGLPELSDAQAQKLRQLSLLTLARDRANLTYDVLLGELGLPTSRALESTVVSAVYAGLVQAKLDPAARCVRVSSIAPLRDLAPGAVPGMIEALRAWSGRCVEGLAALEAVASARGSTLMESGTAADPGDEAMDVDDDEEAKRASRRKL